MELEKKPIPGYEDEYYLDPEIMRVVNKRTGRALKPQVDGSGYAAVSLWKNNKGHNKMLHRLFAEAYIPNPDNLPCVNHKDEDITNYDLDNLEWCDQSYNQNYGTANERRARGISAASKGKPRPWVAEYKSKPIIAVNRDTGEELAFPSAVEAGRVLDIGVHQIRDVLSGRRITAHGYKFYYA